jgi:hypothetical protein
MWKYREVLSARSLAGVVGKILDSSGWGVWKLLKRLGGEGENISEDFVIVCGRFRQRAIPVLKLP